MLGWLYQVIVGSFHVHQWKTIKEGAVTKKEKILTSEIVWTTDGGAKWREPKDIVIGHYYIQECVKCHTIQQKQFFG